MRHLSDEAYIEKIRKKVNTVNRLRWLWPILFFCLFACLIWFIELMTEIEPNPDKYTVLGFTTGIIFGLFFLFTTAQAAECLRNWWEAYRGWRTERLLLKYYDERQANQRGHGTR
jgi:hypothetical protein